jgi:hypothetical protein
MLINIMEDGIDRSMMDAHQDYACMLQNKRIFVHISQEKYIITDDVKKALEFSIKNKCTVKIYTMDKTTGCYKLDDECLQG